MRYLTAVAVLIFVVLTMACASRQYRGIDELQQRVEQGEWRLWQVDEEGANYVILTTETLKGDLAFLEAQGPRLNVEILYVRYCDNDEMFLLQHAGQGAMPDPPCLMQGALGQTLWANEPGKPRRILISDLLKADMRFEVLAHEYGHMFHPMNADTVVREIFAEAVGMEISRRFEHDMIPSSAHYLSGFKPYIHTLRVLREDIVRAADTVTNRK
jgi:hypothetical protein